MNKSILFQRFFLVVFLLLNGCSGSSSSPTVQLQEVSNDSVSYDETIRINNCGGKADSEQTKECSFSSNIEGGIEIGIQQIVQGIISAKYSQARGTSVSHKLIVPAGTNMEFVLRWREEVHAGNVVVNGSTGTYTVKIPIAVEQVSSQDLGCSGNIPNLPSATQAPINTIPPSTGSVDNAEQSQSTGEQDQTASSSTCDGTSWANCWQIDDNAQTIIWIGLTNGATDIAQDGLALQKIKAGYTAVVTLDIAMNINICTGTIDGIQPSGSCPKVIPISSGTHRITSPGKSGGFRIYP